MDGGTAFLGGVCSPEGSTSPSPEPACVPCVPPFPALCMLAWLWPWHVRAGGGKDRRAAAADVCPLSLSICPTLPSQADLCSPSDLLQGTAQGLWTTLEAVKRVGGRPPPPLSPPSGLGGFIFFYVVLMLLLCVVYTRLLGS